MILFFMTIASDCLIEHSMDMPLLQGAVKDDYLSKNF